MTEASNRIAADIACLDVGKLRATLISTVWAHCDVWQSPGYSGVKKTEYSRDYIVKHHTLPCSYRETAFYLKDYRLLKEKLQDIIPETLYVRTRVDGTANVLVIADAYTPWFNLANPAMEDEALPLLTKLTKAKEQLHRFVETAQEWLAADRVIDLYGLDNLVLDRNHEVKYLDSFEVFFHRDILHFIHDVDDELENKINLSIKRLEYLTYLRDALNG
ncbi:MAG: hypothetical protein C0631_17890 [Sedimenticola sp.]|nr:MAG: hypothetical protein C0631_17890 [Sedimenticola sp.]